MMRRASKFLVVVAVVGFGSGAIAASSFARADVAVPSEGEAADPDNRARPPLTSAELDERAKDLFDAIVNNEPARGDSFFFPRDPFIPLKDVQDPGRYFDQLLRTYHRDIASLHAERKHWEGATFVSFTLGTPAGWVGPGKEYNKIGYYRSFHGKLRYRTTSDGGAGKVREIDVGTIISWAGRWYATHLLPIRH